MGIFKWTGVVLGALVVVAGALYLLRTDPIYMISGKRLSGDELPYPADWSMCSDHQTIAVEARVDDPTPSPPFASSMTATLSFRR